MKALIRDSIKRSLFQLNRLTGYDTKIWLIGDGRSGTTWVSSLINHESYFRESFEPFHPAFVPQADFLTSHFYARPDEDHPQLYTFADSVFSGRLWNPRTDQDNRLRLYDGLCVKDIFSNLFANWVNKNFPELKIILLIRNPFAVALSKLSKKNWTWVTDPMSLYNQDCLRDDYLLEFSDTILSVKQKNDALFNQLLIWSIIHYVPFKQFNSDQIHVIFYENVYMNPQEEMSKLFSFIGKDFDVLPDAVISKPSKVVGDSIKKGISPVNSWINQLSPKKINEGLSLLSIFGLDSLYDDNSLPQEFDISLF